jgi:hypothetical protein
MVIEWGKFGATVKTRPEDYIFILSHDEWIKFMELNKQISSGLRGKGFSINEDEYVNKYQGVFVISELALEPDFRKKYKVGSFTHKTLGTSYAVFYINRSQNDLDRSNDILKRIISYQTNTRTQENMQN